MTNTKETKKCPRIKRERDNIVGANIRKYRTLTGLSQEGLAKELGLTFQQVQKYERGMNRVSAGTLFDISQVFGIPVSWMFYNDEDSQKILNGELPTTADIDKPLFTNAEVELIRLFRKTNCSIKHGILSILSSTSALETKS